MQLGMIGLGRMGANMVRRLLRNGHQCVVHDLNPASVESLVKEGASGAVSLDQLVAQLAPPRTVWVMVPAAAVDGVVSGLVPRLARNDVVVDGGNSHYADDSRRARALEAHGIDYLDVGTSGGVFGLERGYCLMIGGPAAVVGRLDPLFRALAPGSGAVTPTPGRAQGPKGGTAEAGYLHCGPAGAGHFVKMVHNGIEYGLMAAYAEGINILRHARYDFDLPDIAEVWRRGSVVSSWLLDLTARALVRQPDLARFSGRVSDSGEGRWTIATAIEEGVPAPVLSAALYERFTSRGEGDFAAKLLSALRFEFGGHEEQP
jgi:6-phosphogluconate dehydrogenase